MNYVLIPAMIGIAAGLAGCGSSSNLSAEERLTPRNDCIDTRCVAAYFPDKTPYLTVQHQQFCPSSEIFEAGGTEPEGVYTVVYRKGQFSTSGLNGIAEQSLPAGLMNAPLAELIFYGFTAGAGFEPDGLNFADSIRIEGQRYEAFKLDGGQNRTVTIYKNAVTAQYELVSVTDPKGLKWLARSYNPRYSERFKRMIPRKMDVFDIRGGLPSKRLMIQFDYIDVQ